MEADFVTFPFRLWVLMMECFLLFRDLSACVENVPENRFAYLGWNDATRQRTYGVDMETYRQSIVGAI